MVEVNRLLPGQQNQGQIAAPSKKDSGEGTHFNFTRDSQETLEELIDGKEKRLDRTRLTRRDKKPKANFLMKANTIEMKDNDENQPLFFVKMDETGKLIPLRLVAVA